LAGGPSSFLSAAETGATSRSADIQYLYLADIAACGLPGQTRKAAASANLGATF